MDMIAIAEFESAFAVKRQVEQYANHPFGEEPFQIVFAEIGKRPAPKIPHAGVGRESINTVEPIVKFRNSIHRFNLGAV